MKFSFAVVLAILVSSTSVVVEGHPFIRSRRSTPGEPTMLLARGYNSVAPSPSPISSQPPAVVDKRLSRSARFQRRLALAKREEEGFPVDRREEEVKERPGENMLSYSNGSAPPSPPNAAAAAPPPPNTRAGRVPSAKARGRSG